MGQILKYEELSLNGIIIKERKVKNGVQALLDCLEKVGLEDWSTLRAAAAGDHSWHKYEWWHNKYYCENPPNDGNVLQQPQKGNPEVPNQRELFYPSPASRFSLGSDEPVAYFSIDFGVNCCETIKQFRSNSILPFKELSRYLGGQGNPTPGLRGYPLNFHLVSDTCILDVSANANRFLMTLSHAGKVASDEIWEVFQNRGEEETKATQRVSLCAKAAGFDEIYYASVRAPVDVSMPGKNLVIFSRDKIRPGLPSNKSAP